MTSVLTVISITAFLREGQLNSVAAASAVDDAARRFVGNQPSELAGRAARIAKTASFAQSAEGTRALFHGDFGAW